MQEHNIPPIIAGFVCSFELGELRGSANFCGKVHRSHVYDFIAGRKELTTEKANYLLNALGLKIIEDTESTGAAVSGTRRRIR